MISIAKLLPLVPAFIAATCAAPITDPNPTPLVASAFVPSAMSTTASADNIPPIKSGQGVVAWALDYSRNWQQPANAQASATAYIQGPSHLILDYTLLFENCGRPEVHSKATSQDPGLQCSSAFTAPCIEKQVGTESWSDAFHLGTKLSISLSATEQAGVPAVASVSVAETVTSEFSMDYTMTNTTTFADAKSWPVPPGMTCVPTQVWWTSNCTQTIQINSFKWYGDNDQLMWPEQMGNINNLCSIWQSPSSGQHGGPPSNSFQWLLAGNNDISANFDDDLGSHFDLITQICSGTMPAPIGLQVNDKNTGVHKSYVGCEW